MYTRTYEADTNVNEHTKLRLQLYNHKYRQTHELNIVSFHTYACFDEHTQLSVSVYFQTTACCRAKLVFSLFILYTYIYTYARLYIYVHITKRLHIGVIRHCLLTRPGLSILQHADMQKKDMLRTIFTKHHIY